MNNCRLVHFGKDYLHDDERRKSLLLATTTVAIITLIERKFKEFFYPWICGGEFERNETLQNEVEHDFRLILLQPLLIHHQEWKGMLKDVIVSIFGIHDEDYINDGNRLSEYAYIITIYFEFRAYHMVELFSKEVTKLHEWYKDEVVDVVFMMPILDIIGVIFEDEKISIMVEYV